MPMFNDPALIFTCDLPIGWCLDSESSLFRAVFRPWDRQDERVILTAVSTAVEPTTPDDDWAIAVASRLGLTDNFEPLSIAPGAAVAGMVLMANGSSYRRIIIRGPILDLVADGTQTGCKEEGIPPILLRIAASARTPARQPLRDPDVESLQQARAAVDALREGTDSESIIRAYRRLESTAEEQWLRSLLLGDFKHIDLDAFEALSLTRVTLGQSSAYLLTLRQAHAALLRAIPNKPATEPYVLTDERLRPAFAKRCSKMFGGVAAALRRRADLEKYQNIPDDTFGSDAFLQMLTGTLIIEAVRSSFEHDQWASPDSAYEGLFAQLCARGMMTPGDSETDQTGQLAEGLWLLGRAATAYVEAAQHEDERNSVVEATDYLTMIGKNLFDASHKVDEGGELYRSEGAAYVVSGLQNCASALVKTADQVSLEQALDLVDEAQNWLQRAPKALVDSVNVSHVEALAALQLGHIVRARHAVRRGTSAARQISDDDQIRFFDWVSRIADVIGDGPVIVRSVPELQYALAEAEEGSDAALRALCAALERDLADNPTGATTIERLFFAAQILGGDGAEQLLVAVDSLLDVKRLLVSNERGLQLGSDDSLLARRSAADIVGSKIGTGELKAAVSAADRARARSLLLDLKLLPGQTAHLKSALDQGVNPGIGRLIDATLRSRMPKPYRVLPKWDGPLGQLHPKLWLQHLSGDLRNWVEALTGPIGAASPTQDETIATVQEHGHPILIFQPIEQRLALFLITPDGAVRHSWSPSTMKEVFSRAQQLRVDLGVWISARGFKVRGGAAPSKDSAAVYRAAASVLYQSLIQPFREHLADQTHLTIIPFRELGSLPYALLEDEAGVPLLEHFCVSIAPSIASLKILKHRVPTPTSSPLAYVVGDPATPSERGLERLPGAAIEAGIVRDRVAATHPGLRIIFRTGLDATPTNYLKEVPGARLVHLACHAGVGMIASASALYLAKGLNGDSTLDFTEIARTPLENALVFLAACRSGAGRPTADGTVGLGREFLRAGARCVVASYWNVSDAATGTLVNHFYDRFLDGANSKQRRKKRVDVSEALRDAMRATRDELSGITGAGPEASVHPGSWAPFFVLGDGGLRDEM